MESSPDEVMGSPPGCGGDASSSLSEKAPPEPPPPTLTAGTRRTSRARIPRGTRILLAMTEQTVSVEHHDVVGQRYLLRSDEGREWYETLQGPGKVRWELVSQPDAEAEAPPSASSSSAPHVDLLGCPTCPICLDDLDDALDVGASCCRRADFFLRACGTGPAFAPPDFSRDPAPLCRRMHELLRQRGAQIVHRQMAENEHGVAAHLARADRGAAARHAPLPTVQCRGDGDGDRESPQK